MSARLATGTRELSVAEFAEELASAAPEPGGGCAGALAGALAAGLVAMVARQTGACDPFGELGFELDEVAREADVLRAELLGLLDEHAAAFERVIAARHSGAPAQELEETYRAAAEPTLGVARLAARVLELAAEVAERAHPHAAADARAAVLLAAASVEATAESAVAELAAVADESVRAACADELRAARARAQALGETATGLRGRDRTRAAARPV